MMRAESRWRMSVLVALSALGVCTACRDNEDSTICGADVDCGSGVCLVAPVSRLEFCADLAHGCSTGHRWASSAGDGLAGLCVELTAIDAGVDGPATPPSGGSVDTP